jgi:hypothetical protein
MGNAASLACLWCDRLGARMGHVVSMTLVLLVPTCLVTLYLLERVMGWVRTRRIARDFPTARTHRD